MASRFLRGTVIAAGISALAGVGLGWAAGAPADPADLPAARKLPADLCARLGDVTGLLPKATRGPVKLAQTGVTDVRCRAEVTEETRPTHTSASLTVVITPYGAKVGGSGAPPIPPETVARQVFDRKPGVEVEDRPYPTKVERSRPVQERSRISVLVVRADLVVQVVYAAHPIASKTVEQVALAMADRAVWEAR